jgi:hypothetical protein
MMDRGLVALGMAADITIFDPNTIIDRATYENPSLPSEGIRHVVINGRIVLADGVPNGARAGQVLLRSTSMPSRAPSDRLRSVKVSGVIGAQTVAIDLIQREGAREATGSFAVDGVAASTRFGMLQTARGWSSIGFESGGRAIRATIDLDEPGNRGTATVLVEADGTRIFRGSIPATSVEIK